MIDIPPTARDTDGLSSDMRPFTPPQIDLSVIIVNWNTCSLLRDCLRFLYTDQRAAFEVIVVDNHSTDGSVEMARHDFPEVRLIVNSDNRGYASANNQAIEASRGRYVLLLNSDTIVPVLALQDLIAFMDRQTDAAVCSPQLLRPNGTPQPYSYGCDPTVSYLVIRAFNQIILHRHLHDWNSDHVQTVDWVSGACLMVRCEAIQEVGLLDEDFFMYFEDNDWCLRMRKHGWRIYFNPQIEITHIGGQSSKKNPKAQRAYYASLRHFYKKHYRWPSRLTLQLLSPIYRLLNR